MIRHAGLIARRVGGWWRGVLIEGPSAAGKSDLTLRALAEGFRLVADDRVLVFVSQGRLFGRPPAALTGLVEVRGVGVMPLPCLRFAQIVLAARCVSSPRDEERFADLTCGSIMGIDVPILDFWPLAASAPAKLTSALERLGARPQPEYQARFASPGAARGRLGDCR
jgi:serine kinase of HPr protein (carbohydrate metabolism regulator)